MLEYHQDFFHFLCLWNQISMIQEDEEKEGRGIWVLTLNMRWNPTPHRERGRREKEEGENYTCALNGLHGLIVSISQEVGQYDENNHRSCTTWHC